MRTTSECFEGFFTSSGWRRVAPGLARHDNGALVLSIEYDPFDTAFTLTLTRADHATFTIEVAAEDDDLPRVLGWLRKCQSSIRPEAVRDVVVGLVALMPGPQGVMPWPSNAPNVSVLCEETRWPLETGHVDRGPILGSFVGLACSLC